MKKTGKDRVHINFKIAVIAAFFFFLMFELHAPLIKPELTGRQITSLGHWDKIDKRCECGPGQQLVASTCYSDEYEEKECTCYDSLTNDIIPGICV